ncbi:MAG TPA: enolase C-terminal domain-like protein [Rhabdochlamydiaceae bacterium]|nr:enolase C-terminal domain-like protein [Rhabdochlamydiaceae bacterium]
MRIVECKWATADIGRKRIIFSLKNENGNEAFGEISPYPSLNQESSDEAFKQLKSVIPLLKTDLSKIKTLDLFPSVAFGIKSALWQLIDPLPHFSCPFSALLCGSMSEIYIQAEKALSLGIKSAKIKIGSLSIDDAKEAVDALKSKFHLRIDLNQKWETAQVFHFFSSYSEQDFDYIEDPLKDPKELVSFPLPFAVDARPDSELSLQMKSLVVKPTILKQFPEIKKPIVLSSCFDTGLNIFHLAALAKKLSLALPQGFGPYLFLKQDVLDHPLVIRDGLLQIPKIIHLDKKLYASLSHF